MLWKAEENAVISAATLGIGDRGFLGVDLAIKGEGWGQGFGGFLLRWPDKPLLGQPDVAGYYICRLLQTVGVEQFAQLVSTPVRLRRANGIIVAIGHFYKDQWFNPSEELKALRSDDARGDTDA